MSTESFIGAVKVKRDEALAFFNEKLEANGGILPVEDIAIGVDSLVGGVLDVLNDQYEEIITAEIDDDNNPIISCVSDLSTLYFEEVSS